MSSTTNDSRPTLPSLNSLSLLDIDAPLKADMPRYNDLDDINNELTTPSATNRQWAPSRNTSASSTLSASPPSSREASPSAPSPSSGLPSNFTLVYTTLEKANALVIVPPQPPTDVDASSSDAKPRVRQPLLVVGPAMEQLRRCPRKLAKGARMHPYRIVAANHRHTSASSIATAIPAMRIL